MGSPVTTNDDAIVGINVTPLVDITLVLLIIFMVTAKLIASQTIPFDLPKAATSGETQVVFVVTVDPEGHVQTDGRPIATDAELRRAAHDALARDHDVRTVVQAAAGVSHGTVIHVLDELRGAGVQKIAFGVDRKAPEGSR
jgi:biopolymer transport protein ExbD